MDGLKNMIAHKTEKVTKQTSVECLVNVDGELEKVLAITGNADISSVELFEKEARVNGDIVLSVLYKTTDDQINTVTTNCSFQDTLKNDVIMPEQKAFARAKLLGINPTSAEGSTVKLVAMVETVLDLAENNQVESYSCQDESVCIKSDELTVNKFCGLTCADFNVESNSLAGENVKKVISLDSTAIITDYTIADGFASISGTVCTYLVALTDENKFKPYQICNDFKEEVMFNDITADCVAEVFIKVKKDAVKVTLEEKENQINLAVTTPVKVCLRGYKTEKLEVVEDIYSTKCELELEKTKCKNVNFYKPKYFESKVEGNLVLSEEEPRIDKVLASSAPCLTVTNAYLLDGQIYVEGVVNTNVIYLNDDDNSINSVEMEVPFKITEKTNLENVDVEVFAIVSDCDVIAKRGREIFFDCKLKVFAQFSENCECEILSCVKEGRVYPQNDASIEIYFAKAGNTVWDIAKELKVTEETILVQNPDLVSPLEKDEKVVVYYNI